MNGPTGRRVNVLLYVHFKKRGVLFFCGNPEGSFEPKGKLIKFCPHGFFYIKKEIKHIIPNLALNKTLISIF